MEGKDDGLLAFRRQWQQELESQGSHGAAVQDTGDLEGRLDNLKLHNVEERAKILFEEAVGLERIGKVFDALPLYKKAVHLVPDIEFKLHEISKAKDAIRLSELKLNNDPVPDGNDVDDDVVNDTTDLYQRFSESLLQAGHWCQPSLCDDGKIAHISDLPLEVLLIICRWIVSNDLDVVSLEKCAIVSKGFYLCARDPEMWRLVCLKIWGVQLGTLKGSPYSSWRNMYFDRSRLQFDGCYISKTSYYRYGENSFQDQFYKPVHHIEYYRYLRFFPDGVVLMLTTADEPHVSVRKLKERVPRKKEILRGFFRLTNDIVTIMLKRRIAEVPTTTTNENKRSKTAPTMSHEQTFHIELKIQSSNSSKRRFNQLQWRQYRILQVRNQIETVTEFDVTRPTYPIFWFSRVEHYSQATNSILSLAGCQ